MNIIDTTEYIRQQQVGRFRRCEDGKGPFAHVNSQKLDSLWEGNEGSVYVNDEKVDTLEKEFTGADFPKLFDTDVGAKVNVEKVKATNEEEKVTGQHKKSAKVQSATKQERFVDEWA
jgi:hypothetical protein